MSVERSFLRKMEYRLRMMHRIHFRSYEERRWSIKIGIVPASPSHQRVGRIFLLCPSGEELDRRKGSSRSMMRFLLLKAFGSSNEGGRLSEWHHDATVVKTSARDEAQPAFVTRNVFGNRRQSSFSNRGLAVSIAVDRRLQNAAPHFHWPSSRLAALSWARNGRGLQ